jgi:hypothetical protein
MLAVGAECGLCGFRRPAKSDEVVAGARPVVPRGVCHWH